jgi:hypothetical protein
MKTVFALLLSMVLFLVLASLLLFNSCSTVPKKTELNYRPDAELWLALFESGCLSREDFLTLLSGGFDAKETEVLKIAASRCGCRPFRTGQDKTMAGMPMYERAKALRERLK